MAYRRRARRTRRVRRTRKTRRSPMRKRGPRRFRKGSLNVHRYARAQEETLYNVWNSAISNAQVAIDNNPIFELPQQTNNGTVQPYGTHCNLVSDCQFQLAKSQGYSEFTPLYDQYKIEKVVLKFEYKGGSPGPGSSAMGNTALQPSILWFEDRDDAVNTNFDDWKERAAISRKWNLRTPFVHTIYPTVLNAGITEGGTIAAPRIGRAPWIDVASPTVTHYGFKFLIQDWPLTDGMSSGADSSAVIQAMLRVTATYYLKFRNVR